MHVPRCLRRWRVLVTQTHGETIGLRRKSPSVLQLSLKVNFLSFLFSLCSFNASLLLYVFSVFRWVSWHEPLSAPFHRDYFLHFHVAFNKPLPPESVSNHRQRGPRQDWNHSPPWARRNIEPLEVKFYQMMQNRKYRLLFFSFTPRGKIQMSFGF